MSQLNSGLYNVLIIIYKLKFSSGVSFPLAAGESEARGYTDGGRFGQILRFYPLPSPDETPSHSTKLANNASQVAGYPPARGRVCFSDG